MDFSGKAITVYVLGEDGSEVQFVIGVTIALVILIGILTIFIVYIIVFHHRMKLLKVCICICESSYFTLSLVLF